MDSRKIVGRRDDLLALRLSHVLFATSDMALQALELLTKNGDENTNFETRARMTSLCQETRDEGGNVGWVGLDEDFDGGQNGHLDSILPPSARKRIAETPSKPGDVLLVESERGVHLVQIVDVRKASFVRRRDGGGGTKLARVLRGAVLDDDGRRLDMTYKIETMGCQMNSADSERIEGQLSSLGLRPLGDDELVDVDRRKTKKEKRKPDLVVFNTCSIRDHAEQKVYS